MNLHTVASRAAAALVAAVAGFASYRHIYDVASEAGEHRGVAAVLPLSIDGLILVGTLALLDDKRAGRHPRASARVALVFGVLATLAANVASAESTVTARLVAAVPAVSFLLAVEVLARVGKPRGDKDLSPEVETTVLSTAPNDAVDRADKTPMSSGGRPSAASRVLAARIVDPDATVADIAAAAGVSTRTARRHLNGNG